MLAAMEPSVAAAAVVVGDDGRVVLIQRGRPPAVGTWTLPGGRVRGGEPIVDAVLREIREETGLVVRVGPLVEVVELISERHHYVVHDHLARVVSGTLVAGDDAADARWVSVDELAEFSPTDAVVRVIHAALALARAK